MAGRWRPVNLFKKLSGRSGHPFFLILRVVLAAIMLYAAVPKFFDWEGIPKTIDFAAFSRSVYNYRLLPVAMVNLVAMTLPAVELIGAITLLSGIWLRAGSLMLALLQAVFVGGVAQAFYRGLDISCGCFVGVADSKVGWIPLVRDSFFLAGFVLIYLTTSQTHSTSGEAPPGEGNSPALGSESSVA